MENEEVIAETVVTPAESIKVDVDVLKFVNLALVQNGLPALRDLRIGNETDETTKDVHTCEEYDLASRRIRMRGCNIAGAFLLRVIQHIT